MLNNDDVVNSVKKARNKKILLAVTTYNQLEYTKYFYETFKVLDDDIDLIIFDDASTDDTRKWATENNIQVDGVDDPQGLTHSWNRAYKHFKEHEHFYTPGLGDSFPYDYLIIANNDILIPKGAIEELYQVFQKWNFSTVVPLSTAYGAGHNGAQSVELIYKLTDNVNDPNQYQTVQNNILLTKEELTKRNNLYQLDPVRMKMFNGFFFMMSRKVIDYELEDGNLFDATKPLYKAEDEFNWGSLIPHNDFPALCKTSFVYHFKGRSTENFSSEHNEINKFLEQRKLGDRHGEEKTIQ